MSSSKTAVGIEELLAHRAWVQSLAVALTRDASDADDVQQQTWLVALSTPPPHDTSVRGWLGTVARNVVRTGARRAEVRGRHAAQVARADVSRRDGVAAEGAAELTARAELHARVAAAVVALDEPCRRAILLRYFEGLAVAEVARALDAPLETTRARLRRGRARLRGRLLRDLGRDGGDARQLAVLLLPLVRCDATARGGLAASTTAAGGALMTGKVTIACAAGLVLLALGWWLSDGGGGLAPSVRGEAETAIDHARSGAQSATTDEPGAVRHRSTLRSAPRTASKSEPVALERPDSGVVAGQARDSASAAGEADVDEVAPSVEERLSRRIDEIVFDNDPLRDILGRISSHANVPIDVDVRAVSVLDDCKTAVNAQAAAARETLHLMATIAGLEFEVLTDRVVLRRAGDEWTDSCPVHRVAPNPVPPAPAPVQFHGRVLDQDGNPVARARVHGLAREFVRTGPDGAFSVRGKCVDHRVVARAAGYVPSDVFEWLASIDSAEDLEIVLGPAAARVTVVVTGSERTPLRRALVRLVAADGSEDVLHTDDEGVATFGESRAAEYTLRVESRGFAPAVQTLRAVSDEIVRVEVALAPRSLAERMREERTEMEFNDEPLSQIVDSLYRRWGVTVRMDPGVPHWTSATRVTLRVPDATLEEAMRAICASAGVRSRLDDEHEVIWIEVQP